VGFWPPLVLRDVNVKHHGVSAKKDPGSRILYGLPVHLTEIYQLHTMSNCKRSVWKILGGSDRY
jgi:hypothetical protein